MATAKSIASGLLFLNFCMYVIVSAIGGWAINVAIDRGFIIGVTFINKNVLTSILIKGILSALSLYQCQGSELQLPAHFSAIHFPMGNAATGFFVVFSLIAGVVGAASAINGINHIRSWRKESSSSAQSSAIIAWSLTLLAMGLACKEIELEIRNACLRTMEAFTIILSATQLIYIIVIQAL